MNGSVVGPRSAQRGPAVRGRNGDGMLGFHSHFQGSGRLRAVRKRVNRTPADDFANPMVIHQRTVCTVCVDRALGVQLRYRRLVLAKLSLKCERRAKAASATIKATMDSGDREKIGN